MTLPRLKEYGPDLGRGRGPELLTPAGYRQTIGIGSHGVKYSGEFMAKKRVIVYIDGYNLYYGLTAAKLRTSRWLDLVELSRSLLAADQELVLVRYFTTRVGNDQAASSRQSTYIDALEARGSIQLDYGHFLSKEVRCFQCGNVRRKSEEKKTDVNIAVRLLEDAADDSFDVAIVMSGDSDLAPPIESVLRRHRQKRVLVAFPPERRSAELNRVASGAFAIGPAAVRANRLPNPVVTRNGITLVAPPGWLPSLEQM